MLTDMVQRRFLTAVGRVDHTRIDIEYVLRGTVVSRHGAVVERLPLLLVSRPYELAMALYKELEDVGGILLCDRGELFREADCSVHHAETRVIDYEDIGIEIKDELDD